MDGVWASIIAAVVSVSIFWLGQVAQRRADTDRRKAAAEDRRRLQAEPVAKQIRSELRAAAALLSTEAGATRAKEIRERDPEANPWRWEPPSDEELEAHTERARDLAFEIPDEGVAAFVKFAAYALEQNDTITDIGGPSPMDLARDVEREVDGVIGAYVHGKPLPDAPVVRVANEALDEHWKRLDAYYEQEHQERLARRAAAKARATNEEAAEVATEPPSATRAAQPKARAKVKDEGRGRTRPPGGSATAS